MPEKVLRNEFILDIDDIVVFREKILAQSKIFDDFIFLESNSTYNIDSTYDFIAAFSSKKKYQGNNFEELKKFLDTNNEYAFGNFCYNLKDDIFGLNSIKNQLVPFSKISFFVPSIIVFSKDNKITISLSNEISRNDFFTILNSKIISGKKNELQQQEISNFSWEEYEIKFNKIKNHIQRGDIYEVNLCNEFYGKINLDPVEIFKKLNSISSAPYAALYRQEDSWLVCSSPELYLKKKASTVITKPIKGTSPRNSNVANDELNKAMLLSSEKERNENVMIVDLARNDLSTIAEKNSVVVTKLFDVETFRQVHQMVSTIECLVSKDIHVVDIIKNTFPMASMTGVPKKRTMEIIEDTESFNRGLYSGSIGFFEPNGDFSFNVVIRSILYNKNTTEFSFAVGSAITYKCNAIDEYNECLLKAKAMIEVLGFES
jgi:para-aminobenzoate synthetase component I